MFGKKIKLLRYLFSYTQDDMGKRLSMDQTAYCKLEGEKNDPSVKHLRLASKLFKIPMEELMHEEHFKIALLGKEGIEKPIRVIDLNEHSRRKES